MTKRDKNYGTFRISMIPQYKEFFVDNMDLELEKILINEDGHVYYEGRIIAKIIDNDTYEEGDENDEQQ